MKGIPQGRYTREFRQEAVKLVIEQSVSWSKAARQLSLPTSTLGNWVKAYKNGKLGDIGKNYRPLTEIEMELVMMKKENAQTITVSSEGRLGLHTQYSCSILTL